MRSHNPQREELVFEAGDAPDPSGTGLIGKQSTTRLNRTAEGRVLVRYKDKVLEVDVYAMVGAPVWIHLICPRCRQALKVSQDRKAIEFDPRALVEDGGRLSVETFMCTWEVNPEVADKHRDSFSNNLCRWRVAIDNNVARDA